MSLKDVVTVLTPTSSVVGNPSTEKIEKAIRSIRAYPPMADAPILVTADGLHPNHFARKDAYTEFKRRLGVLFATPEFAGCTLVEFPEHTHQIGMARRALEMVKTPMIFYMEHDFFLFGEIPWERICDVMQRRADVRIVRLMHYNAIHDAWLHMMLDKTPQDLDGLWMIRTTMWSQNPHFSTTANYRNIVNVTIPQKVKGFIEGSMVGPCSSAPWEKFHMWIYAGSISRVGHSDGRENEVPIM